MAARPGEPYGCAMSVREIVTRPFRLQAWKELAYLLLGLPVGVVTFTVVVTGVALGVSLLITLVGIPVLVATAYADRGLAWLERRRAALVLGARSATPRTASRSDQERSPG